MSRKAFTAEIALPPARSVLSKPGPKECGPFPEAAGAGRRIKIRSATGSAGNVGETGNHILTLPGTIEDHRGLVLFRCQQQARGPVTSRGMQRLSCGSVWWVVNIGR